ncbi:MAG: metalloregulator ArsR/SmtB family transcription factor [Nitrospinota bacterium]|nr:metalloregulator ArsR/SmtB family transcription factor [Nitrospinota bacterium]
MTGMDNPKELLFEQLAQVAKALSSPNRISLLEFLAQGECGVDRLAKLSGMTVANTSQHLQALRHSGLVHSRKSGQNVFYALADESVVDLIGMIRKIAEKNLAEVGRLVKVFLKSKDAMEPIQAQELLQRAKKGLVTVLDVRTEEEFTAGHVAGAVNVPIKKLEKFIKNIKPGQEVVAYCRGSYCLLSFDAVQMLRAKGIKAHRLVDGFPEWKRAGLPVERSKP